MLIFVYSELWFLVFQISIVTYNMLAEEPQCDENIEWQCSDRKGCIDKRRRCDGYEDCSDGSDENEDLCYDCK